MVVVTRSGPLAAVEQLVAAILDRRADDVADAYADRDDLHVFVEGPRWQTVGHAAVARGWRAFLATDEPRIAAVTWRGSPYVHATADLASVSGTVELTTPHRREPLAMRMTWVLAREPDGRWRVVHEHASQPLPDPYGTGDWAPEATADRP